MVLAPTQVKQTPLSARELYNSISRRISRLTHPVAITSSTSVLVRPSQMAYKFKVARATLHRWVIFLASTTCPRASSSSLRTTVTLTPTPNLLSSWFVLCLPVHQIILTQSSSSEHSRNADRCLYRCFHDILWCTSAIEQRWTNYRAQSRCH